MTTARLSWRDAVLSGFQLIASRPAAAFSWALVFAIGGTVMAGFQLWAWRTLDAKHDLSAVAVQLGFSGFALNLVTTVLVCASVLRATIRPEDRYAAWPRFGGDELRLLAFALPLVLVSMTISALISALLYPLRAEQAAYPSIVTHAMRATEVALTLLGARLVLAAPMTVADRRLRLGSALPLSHGRHALLAATFVAALLIAMSIEWAGAVARDMLIAAMEGAPQPVLKSLSLSIAWSAAFGPAAMASRGLGAIVHTLAVAVQVAPIGYAYRRLKGDPIDRIGIFD
ncbi:hypothetical protein [Caulobacter sp. UNC279MFTsu5.1]|uniref:hypothetical protein n=1 Tax=Caulobacter sp. UNC279MFTsu5.1 TaxID=1502775 RepID=UPI0008F02523|nr:hypothetical protein [Caulobacter sp. UNC279MFTsu5.1]SFK26282.1 hypothetical protein SAMN02799626_03833 [Caulobacter sp. UNC279MFTsu5.1]